MPVLFTLNRNLASTFISAHTKGCIADNALSSKMLMWVCLLGILMLQSLTKIHNWAKKCSLKGKQTNRALCQCARKKKRSILVDSCLGNVHSMVRAAGVSAGKLQNHGDVLLYGTSQFLYQIFCLSLFSISKTWSCEVGISLSTTTILFATWKIQQRLFLILYFHAIIEFLLCHQSLVNITIFIASHIFPL